MKVVTIILGALLVLGGIYCVVTPVATYSALAWVIGLFMIVDGVGSITTWYDRKKAGFADGWTLAAAILSLVAGVVLVGSFAAQLAVDLFMAYLVAAWLVLLGIFRIMAALKLRSFHNAFETQLVGANWGFALAMGIILIILGIMSFANPTIPMIAIGLMLGMSIIASGVSLISTALAK